MSTPSAEDHSKLLRDFAGRSSGWRVSAVSATATAWVATRSWSGSVSAMDCR